MEMEQKVLDARAKLAAKFSNAAQIGGKGTVSQLRTQFSHIPCFLGWCTITNLLQLCLCRYPEKKEEACHCLECQ